MTTHAHTLLIDAGNSRIKWALGTSASQSSVHTIEAQGVVNQGDWNALQATWAQVHGVQQIWLCSVADAGCEVAVRQCVQQKFGAIPITIVHAQAQQCGVINQYSVPETLGVDRWMMALAAHHLHPRQSVLIVSAGTATTIDALDAGGHFLGGVILPGLQLMQQALAHNTAGLPLVEQNGEHEHASGFAKNTLDAITSGCLQAQLGAIERLYQQLQQQTQQPRQPQQHSGQPHDNVHIILTGGAASQLAWHLQYPVHLHKNLVLTGLNLVAQPAA